MKPGLPGQLQGQDPERGTVELPYFHAGEDSLGLEGEDRGDLRVAREEKGANSQATHFPAQFSLQEAQKAEHSCGVPDERFRLLYVLKAELKGLLLVRKIFLENRITRFLEHLS